MENNDNIVNVNYEFQNSTDRIKSAVNNAHNNLNNNVSQNYSNLKSSNSIKNDINNASINNSISNNNVNNNLRNVNLNNNLSQNILKRRVESNKNYYNSNTVMNNKLASKVAKPMGINSRIAQAVVNSKIGQKAISKVKNRGFASKMFDMFSSKGKEKKEIEEAEVNTYSVSMKFVKNALLLCLPFFMFMCLFCLIIVGPQVYINSVGIGAVDSVSSEYAEEKIKNVEDDVLNQEIKDEDDNSDVGYVFNGLSKFMISKLNKSNMMLVTPQSRPFNEADLNELRDYYSQVVDYSKDYDESIVYMFFFKLLYIQRYYKNNLNVNLDMPLLMSTLRIQSDDIGDVFASNIKDYDESLKELKENNPNFSYDKDWSCYNPTANNSTYDIEVLAQHMVKKSDSCENCYEIDEEGYREYLKEFLEKKYFINKDENGTFYCEPGTPDTPEQPEQRPSEATGTWKDWKQCDKEWGSIIVPKSNSTICQIGCLITSVTIQIARSGTVTLVSPINPGIAVSKYSFVKGGNFVWNSAAKLAPNFKYYTKINLAGMSSSAMAKKLSSYDSSKYYIILAVSNKKSNKVGHYVALDYADTSTGNLYMFDPGSSKGNNATEKYKIYAAHIYEKKD